MPTATPAAASDAIEPTALGTRSCGNSSRMTPKESGRTPPPTPCRTRAAILTPMLGANAAIKDRTESAANETTNMRSLPTMSPMRPTIGVKIEAESRYAVSTHVTVLCVVCTSLCTVDKTGSSNEYSRAKLATPETSTANVILGRPVRGIKSLTGSCARLRAPSIGAIALLDRNRARRHRRFIDGTERVELALTSSAAQHSVGIFE
jgi:hypothetical protein